jgi:hypothetical protein
MLFNSLLIGLRGQLAMQTEIIALRHQLTVLQGTHKPRRILLNRMDRCLWVWLSRLWSVGVPLTLSSSLKPSSAGIIRDSGGIGLRAEIQERNDPPVICCDQCHNECTIDVSNADASEEYPARMQNEGSFELVLETIDATRVAVVKSLLEGAGIPHAR